MADSLLVTDYDGRLHIVPAGNKDYYNSRNAIIKEKQYKIKEMDEEAAIKFVQANKGIDPAFTPPAQATQIISTQQDELNRLREALKNKDAEAQKLQEQLLKLSTTPTSDTAYSQEAQKSIPKTATAK